MIIILNKTFSYTYFIVCSHYNTVTVNTMTIHQLLRYLVSFDYRETLTPQFMISPTYGQVIGIQI